MGELWEVILNEGAKVRRTQRSCTKDDISLQIESWRGGNLFHAQGVMQIYATERAKDWLESHAGEEVALDAARTENSPYDQPAVDSTARR
jgi:hypothetical protein